jgi:hypothetical protein
MQSSEYDGAWVRGRRQGWGVFRWSDGSKYEGEWSKGKFYFDSVLLFCIDFDIQSHVRVQGKRMEWVFTRFHEAKVLTKESGGMEKHMVSANLQAQLVMRCEEAPNMLYSLLQA